MPYSLSVTLDTNANALDVDQRNNANEVSRDPNAQTITWQLGGNAAAGSFNAMTGTNPGFAWVGTGPSAGIFGTPTLVPGGKQITLSDLNNSDNTTGTWIYRLCATIGGQQYSTLATLRRPTATTTDPCIKNN